MIAFLTSWPFLYFVLFLICSSYLDCIPLLSVLLIHVRSIWSCDDVHCAVQLRIPQTMSRKNLGAAWISQQCHVMMMIIDNSEHNLHDDLWSPQFIAILHRGEEGCLGVSRIKRILEQCTCLPRLNNYKYTNTCDCIWRFCMIVNVSRWRDVCSRIALACFDAIAQCFIQFQQMIPKCRINPFRESQKKALRRKRSQSCIAC